MSKLHTGAARLVGAGEDNELVVVGLCLSNLGIIMEHGSDDGSLSLGRCNRPLMHLGPFQQLLDWTVSLVRAPVAMGKRIPKFNGRPQANHAETRLRKIKQPVEHHLVHAQVAWVATFSNAARAPMSS